MRKISLPLLLALAFSTAALTSGRAAAYPISSGSNEIRPLIGVIGSIDHQPTQFQMGVEWNHSLDGPLGFVLGYWLGFGDQYIGMEVTAGVKYRFLRLHPRVAPFVAGGGGFNIGFWTNDRADGRTNAGFAFRFGGGVDFFATPRIIPGMQIMFDLGPGFTPYVGFFGSVQVSFGVSFLL